MWATRLDWNWKLDWLDVPDSCMHKDPHYEVPKPGLRSCTRPAPTWDDKRAYIANRTLSTQPDVTHTSLLTPDT